MAQNISSIISPFFFLIFDGRLPFYLGVEMGGVVGFVLVVGTNQKRFTFDLREPWQPQCPSEQNLFRSV